MVICDYGDCGRSRHPRKEYNPVTTPKTDTPMICDLGLEPITPQRVIMNAFRLNTAPTTYSGMLGDAILFSTWRYLNGYAKTSPESTVYKAIREGYVD